MVKYKWQIQLDDVTEDYGLEADSLEELKLARIEMKAFTNSLGGEPVSTVEATDNACSKHKVPMRQNKNGKWFHSKGTYPNMEYCNGWGFPSERE